MDATAIIAMCGAIVVVCSTIAGAAWAIRSAISKQSDEIRKEISSGQEKLHSRISDSAHESQARHTAVTEKLNIIGDRVTIVETTLKNHISQEHP